MGFASLNYVLGQEDERTSLALDRAEADGPGVTQRDLAQIEISATKGRGKVACSAVKASRSAGSASAIAICSSKAPGTSATPSPTATDSAAAASTR